MSADVSVSFEHRFLQSRSENYRWLEEFISENDFSRLWIKVFVMDIYYAKLLQKKKDEGCDVRVLIDHTPNPYDKTPLEKLLTKAKMSLDEFNSIYFPIRGKSLHNKYIYFERKDSRSIEWGVITGSLNLTRRAEGKDNDMLRYSIKVTNLAPGFVHLFESKMEQTLALNISETIYDFTRSWVSVAPKFCCPLCESDNFDFASYCYKISFLTGCTYLIDYQARGTLGECDECIHWCFNEKDRSVNPDIIYFENREGKVLQVYGCCDCNAIFTEEGGLIGEPQIFFPHEIEKRDRDWIIRPYRYSPFKI